MPVFAEIAGSTVRDFCMLERNFLSHFKLILLLLLLLTSSLLGTQLAAPKSSDEEFIESASHVGLPMAILHYTAAILTIVAAVWEYHTGAKDLLRVRPYFVGTKSVV